jgi:hypothetical protein
MMAVLALNDPTWTVRYAAPLDEALASTGKDPTG